MAHEEAANPKCGLCGEPMPKDEEMFKYHGYSGPCPKPPLAVASASDARTVNNTMRHQYRVLTEAEKANMQAIKDEGMRFHELVSGLGNSRETSLAKTKIEEAVMWAVKHITA